MRLLPEMAECARPAQQCRAYGAIPGSRRLQSRHCESRLWRWMVCCLLGSAIGCGKPAPPSTDNRVVEEASWFVEITDEAGLKFIHDVEAPGDYFMPEIMGSGGAFVDFDGDGLLDIFLVNGRWSQGGEESRMCNQLYRQRADGTFAEVTLAAGMVSVPGYGVGVAVGDVNNDGAPDVYVTAFGGDRLWVNNGDATFFDRTDSLENVNQRWGTAASFVDYDRDGWLDLFVVNYVDYFPGTQCDEGTNRLDYCGPKSFSGTIGKLYRNLGQIDERGGMFTDVTIETGLAANAGPGLGLICHDFNGDGRPDLYIANDMFANRLWIQQEAGTFRDEAVVRGAAYKQLGQAGASMGIVCDDLNGDRMADLFITNLRGEMNILFLNTGAGQFVDGTAGSGLGAASLPYTGFGAVAIDLEFDGDLDLVVVNGRVKRGAPLPGAVLGSFWNDYAEPNQIFQNDGAGQFTEISHRGGLFTSRIEVTRALVCGDLDNDGDLDLLVTNCGGPARLYRNEGPRDGAWLTVRAINRSQNRDALGAQITVVVGGRDVTREINPSSGYLSSHDVRVNFGLGKFDAYEKIVVAWPDGNREEFDGGRANRQVVLQSGQGRPANLSVTR